MVTLVRSHLRNYLDQAREAFERPRVQCEAVAHCCQPRKPVLRIFQCYPAHNPMDFIAFGHQKLRQVRTVLPGNSGNERALAHRYVANTNGLRISSGLSAPARDTEWW